MLPRERSARSRGEKKRQNEQCVSPAHLTYCLEVWKCADEAKSRTISEAVSSQAVKKGNFKLRIKTRPNRQPALMAGRCRLSVAETHWHLRTGSSLMASRPRCI